MKKFLNTMLVTAAVVAASTTAQAATAGKVAQGAYLGASAGVANTNVKYNAVNTGQEVITAGMTTADEVAARKYDSGKMAGIFGLVAGYNFQSCSLVFGGEIYGGFDSTKITLMDDSASGKSSQNASSGTLSVKRTNFIGFAPRLGFMIAPNTLMYARLGVETGKWKSTLTPNINNINNSTTTDTQKNASKAVVNGSKGGMSFAPGLGMEVYMGKAFIRTQYSYLFGPKVTLNQNITGYDSAYQNGEGITHSMKMTQHKVELAVGYKF